MSALVFIGPSAVGKSSVGRLVAKMLSYRFIDTDACIEDRCGVPISWIFELEGEPGFRAHETRLLESLDDTRRTVLATGGGMVISANNRSMLRRMGLVIYLSADVQLLAERIGKSRDRDRPLLSGGDPLPRLQAMMAQREPLYNYLADIRMQTGDSKSPLETAGRVMERLRADYPQLVGDGG